MHRMQSGGWPYSKVGRDWWKSDLLATKSVEENITKARRTFSTMEVLGCFRVTSVPSHPGLC